ncbi:lytic transglycosylase domain-containing protein [Agromyces sp. ZXT2-6]|uniref:lytic transglycosylase domain-containing protein n=1 Tax=Agromyces sp. ZXT2-6 TaxID=3461153 RepID=UPI0040551B12
MQPATWRQALLQAAGYAGLVVAVVALVIGAVSLPALIGTAVNPDGFAAPSAHGQGVALPPVSAPLDGGDEGDDGDDGDGIDEADPAKDPTDVTGSDVAPLVEPDVEVVDDWVSRTASATGIPARALSAYALAHVSIAQVEPDCGLDWTTIAAIGAIESGHGSHGDAVLADDGTVQPTILGRALDGDGVAAIRDTDGGALDGDARWDRAVGPMQFIPSTWAIWGIDANGDGVADPNHIDDAAHATALYLCASGPMTSPEGWREAVFSYNHDNAYVDKVATIANGYVASVG